MVRINGNDVAAVGMTVGEYVMEQGLNPAFLAVELNGNILPKSSYEVVSLNDGDKVEIVNFVGGG